MKFEYTTLYKTLLDHFYKFGKEIIYEVNGKQQATDLFNKTVKYYGNERTLKIAKKANQKLHSKLYPTK